MVCPTSSLLWKERSYDEDMISREINFASIVLLSMLVCLYQLEFAPFKTCDYFSRCFEYGNCITDCIIGLDSRNIECYIILCYEVSWIILWGCMTFKSRLISFIGFQLLKVFSTCCGINQKKREFQ